jgi:hypothetical protein
LEKQVYLLRHKHNRYLKYVGSTIKSSLNVYFRKRWQKRYEFRNPLNLAFAFTEKADWEIVQLSEFTADWEKLEHYYIEKYSTFKDGLNCTSDGQMYIGDK